MSLTKALEALVLQRVSLWKRVCYMRHKAGLCCVPMPGGVGYANVLIDDPFELEWFANRHLPARRHVAMIPRHHVVAILELASEDEDYDDEWDWDRDAERVGFPGWSWGHGDANVKVLGAHLDRLPETEFLSPEEAAALVQAYEQKVAEAEALQKASANGKRGRARTRKRRSST